MENVELDDATVDRLVASLARIDDRELERTRYSHTANALRERITHGPAARMRRAGPTPRLLRVGVAAAVLALAVSAAISVTSGTPASAGVDVRREGDHYVARITDPERDRADLNAAFAEHGLAIDITLVPVSPSLVGSIVMLSDDGSGGPSIETLDEGPCVTGGGGCPIGLRVPVDHTARAEVTLGRRASADETYVSVTSIWAPGEAFACRDMYGWTVSDAVAALAADGITSEFRAEPQTVAGSTEASVRIDAPQEADVSSWYVSDVLPATATRAIVFATDAPPPPRPADYEQQIFAAC